MQVDNHFFKKVFVKASIYAILEARRMEGSKGQSYLLGHSAEKAVQGVWTPVHCFARPRYKHTSPEHRMCLSLFPNQAAWLFSSGSLTCAQRRYNLRRVTADLDTAPGTQFDRLERLVAYFIRQDHFLHLRSFPERTKPASRRISSSKVDLIIYTKQ